MKVVAVAKKSDIYVDNSRMKEAVTLLNYEIMFQLEDKGLVSSVRIEVQGDLASRLHDRMTKLEGPTGVDQNMQLKEAMRLLSDVVSKG